MTVRTRFAPSPTGYMHIGNLRTALYEYLLAKKMNGKFILRIEDTDQERYVDGAVDIIYKSLKKAGIVHDEGPDIGGEYGPYIQSERKHIYKPYAEELIKKGKAYYCFCTKERLSSLRADMEAKGLKYNYDKKCLSLTEEEVSKNIENNLPYVIRQKTSDTGTTSYKDAVYGEISIENKEIEDQILIKADGLPTYNFANVIDDHLMKITHVIRGSEYLSSTPKYILLYNAFNWEIPSYVHLPLITKEGGAKISKRSGDASFEDLLQMGYLEEAVINYITLLGWSSGDEREMFSLKELEEVFDIKGISKSPSTFSYDKLDWFNGEYIKNMSEDDFFIISKPYIDKILSDDLDKKKISDLLKQRTVKLTDITENIDFFKALPDYDTDIYIHKRMKTNPENSLETLIDILPVLKSIDSWDFQSIHDKVFEYINQKGVKNGLVLWPLRTALSGKQTSPGGGFDLAVILGREESLRRVEAGIEKLRKNLNKGEN
jgi:glutamyl-tRNA synthetase